MTTETIRDSQDDPSPPFAANRWPVVIVGAGPAGLAAGLALAGQGVRPLVLDRSGGRSSRKIGESLAPRAWPILQRLGIDKLVVDSCHLASPGTLSNWGHEGLVTNDFLMQPHGRGWHLDRSVFEDDLRDLACRSGVSVLRRSLFVIDRDPGGDWIVRLDSGEESIQARFLVDASGRPAAVASRAGARRLTFDRLAAWYAFMESKTPIEDARAMVEARPDGWWYSALLPGGQLVVAKFCDPGTLAGRDRSVAEWANALNKSEWTRQRLLDSGYTVTDGPHVAAADCAISDPVAGPGWVACGDAAACYDPLSSHGIATAIASGTDAGLAVHAALAGDPGPMAAYASRVERSFAYFLKTRAEVYAQELRWPDEPFWSKRRRLDLPDRGR